MTRRRSFPESKTVKLGFLALGFAVLMAQTGHGQATAGGPLKFFKNYFITGDYASAGVGLDKTGSGGLVSGTVNIEPQSATNPGGVPPGAEAIAAFLYWQAISPAGPSAGSLTATFNGQPLSTPDLATDLGPEAAPAGPLAVVGDPFGTVACPLTGGGSNNRVYAYRADVLRFLDVDAAGLQRITGPYTVKLPDGGGSSQMPRAIGASLVVIYRDPNPAAPLNAIVMYDGNYTKQSNQTMAQTIAGYYDPALVPGKITHIVGSAQPLLSERLRVPGSVLDDRFQSAQGASWDNFTTATASPGASSFVTSVEPRGLIPDCLTWGAIVYRTQVNDSDGDGLLNLWESSTSAILDPNGEPLPILNAMGADPSRKDLFVEIASMATAGPLYYGDSLKPMHDHLPTYEALKKVGKAFLDQGITLHVDVGGSYQGIATGCYAAPCLPSVDPVHIIPTGQGARGGESMDETITNAGCITNPDVPWECQFSGYPGTVGWKIGYRFLRDMPLFADGGATPTNPTEAECEAAEEDGNPGTRCDRIFDSNRKDMFHFVLFAHALGIPKEDCIGADGFPDFACEETNHFFHEPVTNTGVGDPPGGDGMVTLGGFNDPAGRPVGTDYMQAATLAHELGHGLGLLHGAVKLPSGIVQPDAGCKPNYLSVMNYLFQLRGLMDDGGVPHVDFSGQTLAPLTEAALSGGIGPVPYRTGWYARKADVAAYDARRGRTRTLKASASHCDGSALLTAEATDLAGGGGMVRVDTETVAGTANAIDWNYAGGHGPQDINFDGVSSTAPLNGFNDWENLRLNQIGSRRNVGAWYWVKNPDPSGTPQYFAFLGPLSAGVKAGDLSGSDLGKGGLGKGGLGKGGLGVGDLNLGDMGAPAGLGKGGLGKGGLGKGGLGKGGLGKGGLGKGGLGKGGLGEGDELDTTIFAEGGFSPPTEVKAFVRGTLGEGGSNSSVEAGKTFVPEGEPTACTIGALVVLGPADCHRNWVDWKLSTAGPAESYRIFREINGGDSEEITGLGYVEYLTGEFRLIDPTEFPAGLPVKYVVSAIFPKDDPSTPLVVETTETSESNPASITTVNTAPTAYGKAVGNAWEDTAIAIDLKSTDPLLPEDPDSTVLTFGIVTGPSHASGPLSGTPPAVTYSPSLNYNMVDGLDSFTFKVHEASTWHDLGTDSEPATVTITVNPVNDAPSFTKGANQTVTQPVGAQTVAAWATNIRRGPLNGVTNEDTQAVDFIVTNITYASGASNPLFSVLPAIAPDGTLTYTPATGAAGVATVTVAIHDNGGVAEGHGAVDTSATQQFTITVIKPPYTLKNVSNLPPGSGVTFKPNSKGTEIELEFELRKNGSTVNSTLARPRMVISGPAGWTTTTYAPGCTKTTTTACNSFLYESSHNAWDLHWKPVNAVVGTYYVIVYIDETGQRFPETGSGFPLVFKK